MFRDAYKSHSRSQVGVYFAERIDHTALVFALNTCTAQILPHVFLTKHTSYVVHGCEHYADMSVRPVAIRFT